MARSRRRRIRHIQRNPTWRHGEDAKMKITRQPGSDPTLHVPAKKSAKKTGSDFDDDEPVFDPELRYSFQRNMQVYPSTTISYRFALLKLVISVNTPLIFGGKWRELGEHGPAIFIFSTSTIPLKDFQISCTPLKDLEITYFPLQNS